MWRLIGLKEKLVVLGKIWKEAYFKVIEDKSSQRDRKVLAFIPGQVRTHFGKENFFLRLENWLLNNQKASTRKDKILEGVKEQPAEY